MHWARDRGAQCGLSATGRHVLLLLATYADDAGECYPGVATLADGIGRDPRRVHAAIKELRDAGLIDRRRRGPGRSALTRLLADLTPASDQDATPASNQDLTPASPKTRRERHPRPDTSVTQNYQGNGQGERTPLPPVGESRFPDRPNGNRRRDRDRWEAVVAAFAAECVPGVHLGHVKHAATMLERRGVEPTSEAIRSYLAEHQVGVVS